MKKRIFVVLSILGLLIFTFIPSSKEDTNLETEYNIQYQYTLDSTELADFGVQIDSANTNDTVILDEDPIFNFAFFYNVSCTSWGGYLPYSYGKGIQPDVWWNSQEVNFTKYGDNEVHFLETRMYGSFEVYIDDYSLGQSNFFLDEEDNNQTVTLDLSLGEHYLTIIAAEYQLPYVGATINEAQLVWTKDQHMFYVIASSGDSLPIRKDRDIFISTIGTPFTAAFDYVYGLPMERPIVELLDINDTSLSNIEISYRYNVSTDGNFSVVDGPWGVEFGNVGDGAVVRWINDDPFSTGIQQLRSHHNYIYICGISTNPDDFVLYYCSYYGWDGKLYPTLMFDTLIVDLYVETEYTEYVGEETTTITIYETEYIAEYSFIPISTLLAACTLVPLLAIYARRKKQGGKENEI